MAYDCIDLDARNPRIRGMAELLRAGLLRPVYHGHEATRQSKKLVRGYERIAGHDADDGSD